MILQFDICSTLLRPALGARLFFRKYFLSLRFQSVEADNEHDLAGVAIADQVHGPAVLALLYLSFPSLTSDSVHSVDHISCSQIFWHRVVSAVTVPATSYQFRGDVVCSGRLA